MSRHRLRRYAWYAPAGCCQIPWPEAQGCQDSQPMQDAGLRGSRSPVLRFPLRSGSPRHLLRYKPEADRPGGSPGASLTGSQTSLAFDRVRVPVSPQGIRGPFGGVPLSRFSGFPGERTRNANQGSFARAGQPRELPGRRGSFRLRTPDSRGINRPERPFKTPGILPDPSGGGSEGYSSFKPSQLILADPGRFKRVVRN